MGDPRPIEVRVDPVVIVKCVKLPDANEAVIAMFDREARGNPDIARFYLDLERAYDDTEDCTPGIEQKDGNDE